MNGILMVTVGYTMWRSENDNQQFHRWKIHRTDRGAYDG